MRMMMMMMMMMMAMASAMATGGARMLCQESVQDVSNFFRLTSHQPLGVFD